MKRVLFIAYYYPPLADSGTQRPLKFSKYLPDFGWEPVVLTVGNPPNRQQDPALMQGIRPGTRILRVPMRSDTISRRIGALARPLGGKQALAEAIEWRIRRLQRMPDIYACWRRPARAAALELFHREGFDAIYATGYPWTSVLIGRDVARATGRPLVADFRDPWASDEMFVPPLTPSARARHYALEASVVGVASTVVAVSDSMTTDLRDAHPHEPREKFVTIENGFDPADLAGRVEYPRTEGTFRLVYTGVWRRGYGPEVLYDAIAEVARQDPHALDRFELVTAGFAPGEAERRGLSAWITELGRISHPHALGLMHSADALFVAAAEGAYQRIALPGKLFEYLGAGRPILLLCDKLGEAARLIDRMGGGVVIDPADRGRLRGFVQRGAAGLPLGIPPRSGRLEDFHRRTLSGKLASVLTYVSESVAAHSGATVPSQQSVNDRGWGETSVACKSGLQENVHAH